jgi:hypothetical protein
MVHITKKNILFLENRLTIFVAFEIVLVLFDQRLFAYVLKILYFGFL